MSSSNSMPLKSSNRLSFYQHEQNWSNRLILGDSLLTMTSLSEKEALRGKVQTVYFDPPYGIGFGSNWQVSTRETQVRDGKLDQVSRQPEQIRAFRDTWKDGIHSYLPYLRDRLTVSRDLLADTGHVFVQIGDENVHVVRSVLDEVFGPENFISLISFRKTGGATADFLPGTTDYVVWYAKDRSQAKYRRLYRERQVGGVGGGAYTRVLLPDGTKRPMTPAEVADPASLPQGAARVPMETQRKTLEAILAFLAETPRIASIHSYRATVEVLDCLEAQPVRGAILHWWLGDPEQTARAVELGCWFSVNASSVRNDVLGVIPLDRLLTETDHPFGDRRNRSSARPGNVAIAEKAIGVQHDLDAPAVRSRMWSNLANLVGEARCASLLPRPIRLQLMASGRF